MPFEARQGEVGPIAMRYVYLLQSVAVADQRYVGVISNLRQRLADHNGRKSPYTSKYRPWKLVTYVAFSDEQKAAAFELYKPFDRCRSDDWQSC